MIPLLSPTHRYVDYFQFTIYHPTITLLHANIPSVIIQFQLAFPLFVVIIGKQGKKTADGFYRLGSALADFLFLQTQQQYAVKRLKTGLQFGFFRLSALLPQFHNKRQRFEICRIIKGILRGSQQIGMQVRKVADNVAVNLQMPFLRHPLGTHHIGKIAVPLLQSRMFFGRITGDDIAANQVYIALVSTKQILHLPHIYKVFGNILLFQLL